MTFEEYQTNALLTAAYPARGHNIIYPALGLVGEAGEVAEKVKKLWRNHNITDGGYISDLQKKDLISELGDILWYVAAISDEIGTNIEIVAHRNLIKLSDRKQRDVIKSEGDNR